MKQETNVLVYQAIPESSSSSIVLCYRIRQAEATIQAEGCSEHRKSTEGPGNSLQGSK